MSIRKKHRAARDIWTVGTKVDVYSKSLRKWYSATIVDIYEEDGTEWLSTRGSDHLSKDVRRYSRKIRECLLSEDDTSTTDDDYKSDDEIEERFVVLLERSGTLFANGKYISNNDPTNPVFIHESRETCRIYLDQATDQWLVIDTVEGELYGTDIPKLTRARRHERDFDELEGISKPPRRDWMCVDGEAPPPVLRYFSEEPRKLVDLAYDEMSPYERVHHAFDVDVDVDDETIHLLSLQDIYEIYGLQLDLIQESCDLFVGVTGIRSSSLAEEFSVEVGYFLVAIEGYNISHCLDIEDALWIFSRGHVESEGIAEIEFAKRKTSFQIPLVGRAGASVVNGKYSVTDIGRFVQNRNNEFEIVRTNLDEEKDTSTWVMRRVTTDSDNDDDDALEGSPAEMVFDFYVAICSAQSDRPPEIGWEVIEPNGKLPSPGVVYRNVPLEHPPPPVIHEVQPFAKGAELTFTVQEPMRPAICPNMEVWCEVLVLNVSNPSEAIRAVLCEVDESPFFIDGLVNGNEYQFAIKLRNSVTYSLSNLSPRVMPLAALLRT